jgi:hypothetical protein
MTEKETRLEQAIRQVAETKRFIAELRQRIEKLKAAGISTHELVAAEGKRAMLIGQINLRERADISSS